jgi:hypothetical protein
MTTAIATTALATTLPDAAAGGARAGYGVSLNDVAAFERSLDRQRAAAAHGWAGETVTVTPSQLQRAPGEGMQALFRPLEQINGQAAQLSAQAHAALDAGRALTPGEMVMLTVKCHEFMFHCQLTANVANRTSDGLQQLFRQQA